LSFFDDGEETAARPSPKAPRKPRAGGPRRPATSTPRPRRPQGGGGGDFDDHTLMIRRRVALGAGFVLLIVIVLLINGCLKSGKLQSLKDYNRSVSQLAQESDAQVSHPLFGALTGASSKTALNVELQIDELGKISRELAARAKAMSVPGEMAGAQRALLTVLGLRAEGMGKVGTLVRQILGGHATQAGPELAGEMELFLASDVLYSQRVAPLIQEALANSGINGLGTTGTRFLPNLGWLVPATALSRITGQGTGSSQGTVAPGTHGSSLLGVSVGTNALEVEPALNHISGGGSPTFTVSVEDTGSNQETNVKVDVTVTAGGKTFKHSGVIATTQPGAKADAEVPVTGIPVGQAAKIEVSVEPVPGETNTENNKNTYLAIFGE
jgi:hypothetical protein